MIFLESCTQNQNFQDMFEIFCNLLLVQILMAMNTAGTLTGCGGRRDLILVRVAKVLMETEIGIINGEVLYSSL